MKVSVVILAWNSARKIEACLASLPAGLTASHEVIVVDNGSRDLTVSVLRDRFPQVRIIANRKNLGVAPARNQGIRCARGEYILILDDDTIVHPAALDQLVQLLDASPEVGLCGPRLVDAEGQLCLSCRLFPTLLDKIGRRFPSALTHRAARRAGVGGLGARYAPVGRLRDWRLSAHPPPGRLTRSACWTSGFSTVRKMSICVCACTRRGGRWSTSRPRW